MKGFRAKGQWWIAGHEDDQVAGILEFESGNGAYLELIGKFSIAENVLKDFRPLIQGAGDTGKVYTLYACIGTKHSWHSNGIQVTKYAVDVIFEGALINEESDLLFRKAAVGFTYLFDWLNISAIDPGIPKMGSKELIIESVPIDPIPFSISSGEASFVFNAGTSGGKGQMSIIESRHISFVPNSPSSLDKILNDFVYPFEALLDLATTRANVIDNLVLFHHKPESRPIFVYFEQPHFEKPSKYRLYYNDLLFALDDFVVNRDQGLKSWYELHARLQAALELYGIVLMKNRMYLDLQFLNIVRAIESYARGKKGIKKIRLKNELVDLLNEQNMVMSSLQYDYCAFAEYVVRTRDYFTHLNNKQKAGAATGGTLFTMIEHLKVLFQCCLMSEIHFDEGQRVSFFKRNKRYNQLAATATNSSNTKISPPSSPATKIS